MKFRHLRYFATLAEELSFTAAARRLHISQPPLSQQIREFEEQIGTSLFERTSRRVELTPAGMALLKRARSILDQVDAAGAEARAIGEGLTGTLDIGTTGSVLMGPLSPLLVHYRRLHPDVAVRLHELSPYDQIAALEARRTDISFVRTPIVGDELVDEPGWAEPVAVALPTGHPLTAREKLVLTDLADQDLVWLRLRDSGFAQYLRHTCIEVGFMPRISQEVVEAYSLASLVEAGFGLALVPNSIRNATRAGVVYRDLVDPPQANVRMVYHHRHSAVLARFLTIARDFLQHDDLGQAHWPKVGR